MRNKIFKITAVVAGVYHLGLAFVGLIFPIEVISDVVEAVLRVSPSITPQFEVMAQFISVYMAAFGIMLLILASNPQKYKALVYPVLLVFGLRLIHRTVSFGAVQEAFGTSWNQNIFTVIAISFFLITLFVTRPRK